MRFIVQSTLMLVSLEWTIKLNTGGPGRDAGARITIRFPVLGSRFRDWTLMARHHQHRTGRMADDILSGAA